MQQKISLDSENILVRLKRETEPSHLQTERLMPFSDPNFSVKDYRELLVKLYKFYRRFEPELTAALSAQKIDFDYENRLKIPKLIADLRNLGMDENALQTPNNYAAPSLDSAEKVFGALYVVEGSTLGGQIISRHLKEKFGFSETSGAAFFSGYGTQTGRMWNEFREAISEFRENNSSPNEIIGAANETFEKFGRAISRK